VLAVLVLLRPSGGGPGNSGAGDSGPPPEIEAAVKRALEPYPDLTGLVPAAVSPWSDAEVVFDPVTEAEVVRNEIIAALDTTADQALLDRLERESGGQVVGGVPKIGVVQIRLPAGTAPERTREVAEKLKTMPGVSAAGLKVLGRTDREVNDFAGLELPADTPAADWGQQMIRCPDAWDLTMGHRHVKIALIDRGFMWIEERSDGGHRTHPDITDSHRDVGCETLPSYSPKPRWREWLEGKHPDDHGTHVAGIMAADADNGKGIAGVAPHCSLMAYRSGLAPDEDSAALIRAAERGCRAVNYSAGYPGSSVDDVAYYIAVYGRAIQEARKHGTVFVQGAGNDERLAWWNGAAALEPELDNYIVVAACDNMGRWAEWPVGASNYGPEVTVAAPGSKILSAVHRDSPIEKANDDPPLALMDGTSMAAPFVTGLCGLIASLNPDLSAAQIKQAVLEGAKVSGKSIHGPDGVSIPIIDARASLDWAKKHSESASSQPTNGLVAFTRSGNVFIRDLGTGDERQLTHDGVTGGSHGWWYGAPTFRDAKMVLAARWESVAGGHEVEWTRQIVALSLDGQVTTTKAGPQGAVGFGLSRRGSTLLYLAVLDDDGYTDCPDLGLVRRDSRGREELLPPRSWFGTVRIDCCRLRLSDDGAHVSVPRFPSDVSSFYSLWSIATGEQVDLVWGWPDSCHFVTDIDFGEECSYVGLWNCNWDRDAQTAPPSGLWRMTSEFRPDKLIASCDTRGGIAVSEELGVAAAATSGLGDPDACQLNLVDLSSGAVSFLCRGGDPDLWPRGAGLRESEVESDLDEGELAEYARRLRVGSLDGSSSVAAEREALGYFWIHSQSPRAAAVLVELARDRRTVMRAEVLRILAARYGSSPGVPQALVRVAGDSTDGDTQRLARLCAHQLSAPDGRTWVIEDGMECVSEAGTLAEMPFGTEVEILGLEPPPGHDNSESPDWVWAKVRAVGDGRIWYLADGALLNRPPHEWWGHADGVTCPYCD